MGGCGGGEWLGGDEGERLKGDTWPGLKVRVCPRTVEAYRWQ